MNIALIGFGGVGKAFVELLRLKKDILGDLNIKYILKSDGGLYCKDGLNIDIIESCTSWSNITIDDIIKNNDIDCLIELTSTNIYNGEPGYSHIKKALLNNIHVITGNKGPILLHYNELKTIASKNNIHLKVGCTTGGALPSINVGTIDTLGSNILKIEGVLNGTTNFILDEMELKGVSYEEALKEAQRLEIAEANPTLDVDGYDTAIKILILTNVILDKNLTLEDCYIKGISHLTKDDILKAKLDNKRIKLIGKTVLNTNKLSIVVSPEYIDTTHNLYNVCGKNKGVTYTTDTLGDMTIIGGASSPMNAAASILRDILSIKSN